MRFIFFILSILGLLLVGAVVGPSFVDWNKYKPQIIEQVKNATGLDVAVNGDLSLAVLPSPRVKIEDMVIAAPLKKNFENILSMKSAEVSVQLIPLIRKEVKVKSVAFIAPNIQVEIMEDGRPSWTTDKLSQAQEISDASPEALKKGASEASSKVLESIALDKLEVKDAQLTFVDHQTGASHSAKNVNIILKANSLNGPFEVTGDLVYQGKKIALDVNTGKLPKGDEGLSVQAELSLPDATTSLNFKGVSSIAAPYDVQGQTSIKVKSPAKLEAVTGVSVGGYNKAIGLEGLLSANENNVAFDNLKLSLGDFIGNGKIAIQNLKAQNPVKVTGNIKASSVLNLDDFMAFDKKTAGLQLEIVKSAHAETNKSASNSFVPNVLTLPMLVDADMTFDLGGVKVQGQTVKAVFLDLNKAGKITKASFKALDMPGQGKVDGNLNIQYASESKSSKTGEVTYSDPTVSYAVNGQVNQLASFFKAFAPDADTSTMTKLYKTAQFNLKGNVSDSTVSLKDSVLKLDAMVIGLAGSYKSSANGRDKASIDISAGDVDFDRIMQAQGKSASSSSTNKSAGSSANPFEGFSLPLDVDFDVSLQKARINNADLNGLRFAGDLVGQKLNLKTAAINNFAGATLNLKGQIANLSELSGLDLSFYTKASDIGALAKALQVDVSSLPKGVKAVEANLTGKGNVNQLNFTSNIKALSGQLEAGGVAKNLLGTPSFNGLSIGLKHPNLVKAMQIIDPTFEGQAGLRQAIDFYAKADMNGNQYDLSDMKVNLGATNFGGNLKINTGANPVSVRGNIAAGKIALDSLLGVKTSSGGGASKSSSGSEALDLSWMKELDVDVALSASSLTYDAWNFTKPSTNLKIANGQMNVSNMKVGLFGGTATLTTQVNASPVSLSLKSGMSNIDVAKLVKALSGSNKLQTSGAVNFDLDVKSAGASSDALMKALNGTANLNGTNVTVKGFDLVKLARVLADDDKFLKSAAGLVTGTLSGGQTKFDTVKGDYKITNGKVNIQSMAMDNAEAVINSTGYVDLPTDYMKVNNEISLKNVEDIKSFSIEIKGSLSNPKTFGKNVIEDLVSEKLKAKIAKKLPDVLGDSATEKLKKFGVVGEDGGLDINNLQPDKLLNNFLKPKETEPKAAPAPANDNAAPAKAAPAPAPEKVEPAPVQKIKKPEDALKSILNNQGSPEDAVNDLIKGLF